MEEKVESRGVVVVILTAAFLFTFSQFLLITSYPTIMDEFNLNATQVQWLTTVFILTTIVFIPMSGYLSNTFSANSLVIFALSCLFIGTVIGGLSPNFLTLVASRAIQAIGAGIILPLVQTILLTVFPYERRGFAMGLLGAVVNVAPASAPSLTGIIIDILSWRSLHWIMLPFITATLVLSFFAMKDVLEKQPTRLDFPSIMLSAIGFSLFIFGLSNISVFGFMNIWVIVPLVIGGAAVFIFMKRQFNLELPILNLHLFRNRTFYLTMILIFINLMLLLSTETILPMFAQDILGTSAFLSGFLLVPGTIILSLVTIISGNLYDKFGGKNIILVGFILTFISLILLNTVSLDNSPYWIMLHFCLFMAGFGLTLMPLVTLSMNAIDNKDIAHGSAIVNTVRQFGMAFGIIVLTTIISVTAQISDEPYQIGAYWGTTYAFIVMAALALAAALITTLIRDER